MPSAPGIPPLHGIKDQEVYRVLSAVVQNIEVLMNGGRASDTDRAATLKEIQELKRRIAMLEAKL